MSTTAWHSPFTAPATSSRRSRGGATLRTGRLAAPESALTSMAGRLRIECAGGHARSIDRRITEGELR